MAQKCTVYKKIRKCRINLKTLARKISIKKFVLLFLSVHNFIEQIKKNLLYTLIVTSLDLVDSTKEDEPMFRSKKSMRAENWMRTSFFELFLGDLDEKMTSAGYRRKWNKKRARQCKEPIIYSICGLCHVQVIKSLPLDNFSLRSQKMVPNYFLYPYKYPECHLRKIWPKFWANRHFPTATAVKGFKVVAY